MSIGVFFWYTDYTLNDSRSLGNGKWVVKKL